MKKLRQRLIPNSQIDGQDQTQVELRVTGNLNAHKLIIFHHYLLLFRNYEIAL